jgi:hypothetical protein|tara:strand:+ start:2079 stop:2279 length:201 start_codon:yes stop_codon:yes gene_type:complete
MNKFERWIFKRLVRKSVRVGANHSNRIIDMYYTIRCECQNEFTEENEVSMNFYLTELFNLSKQKDI